jgi:hypothetical protein
MFVFGGLQLPKPPKETYPYWTVSFVSFAPEIWPLQRPLEKPQSTVTFVTFTPSVLFGYVRITPLKVVSNPVQFIPSSKATSNPPNCPPTHPPQSTLLDLLKGL